ncbi:thioredoxin-dependent thiol peroxidase [Kaistella jeonii]|uniref:thioredoxin-dependent peroxiredoxin n=1 Tax=Kaistella jeonii TaxID=266749 RepID=A0A0C1D640_9FLAO|nr:thioredoxin-dependent thiol peroxidase [Kaistella jeonii]KIA89250.1 thiol peroxidase [Kaistella jeonii]SFC01083.1 peroxiredoxin Q/BCP [Kaistella jeonii]VEI96559.1 Putative peroxiredoxin bcp [Kaistella jeonii]
MLKVGDKLPELESVNQDGETVKSTDFSGNKLIIFFYPRANTPGCTAEACDLNDNISILKKEGYQLLGVSADSVTAQKKFHEKFGFQYPLIADENKDIIEKFGVWQLKKFMGKEFMGIVRTTFIFDENGICIRVIDKVKTKEAAKQILENS